MVMDKISAAVGEFDSGTEQPTKTSIGVAELKDGDSIDQLLIRADMALYDDKSHSPLV